MAKVSEAKKILARMLYLEGKSQDFIAQTVGVTQATISNWIQHGEWEASQNKVMSIPMWAIQTAANIQEEMYNASKEVPMNILKVAQLLDIYNKITQKTDIVHLTRYNIGLVKFISEKFEKQHANEVLDPNKNFIQNLTILLDEFIKDYLND